MNTIQSNFLIAQGSGQGGGENPFGMMFTMIMIMVIMYFVMIRPQRKRQKELQQQIDALRTGDKVITSGGIHGLVTNIKDSSVILKIADNTKIELEKASVQSVVKKKDSAAGGGDPTEALDEGDGSKKS